MINKDTVLYLLCESDKNDYSYSDKSESLIELRLDILSICKKLGINAKNITDENAKQIAGYYNLKSEKKN